MAKSAQSDAALEPRGLFPWFPAHGVTRGTRENAERLIGQIPLFNEVPQHRLRSIVQVARRERFTTGDVVIREGEVGSTLYVIRSGRMHVVREGDQGHSVVLATLGPGEYFGELSIFDREVRSATVLAVEDTETLTMGRYDIVRMVNHSPEMALALLKSLSARLRIANDRLSRGSSTSSQP